MSVPVEVLSGTVPEVLDYAAEHPEDAEGLRTAERLNRNRSTLIAGLTGIIEQHQVQEEAMADEPEQQDEAVEETAEEAGEVVEPPGYPTADPDTPVVELEPAPELPEAWTTPQAAEGFEYPEEVTILSGVYDPAPGYDAEGLIEAEPEEEAEDA